MRKSTNYDYTSSESEEERPRKRTRFSPETYEPTARQIILEEIDLEVALRQRLASTVESRITWALLLQEALNRETNPSGTGTEFRDAALDALEAIEAPCQPLFTRDVRQIQFVPPPQPPSVSAAITPATPVEPVQPAPTSTYATRNRGSHRAPRAAPKKLLFIRNTATNPPQLAKLACPDCSRTDFSSLQGLLNHCRLSHKREFGSHDECVQCCAVLVESLEDQAHIIANGTEVAGITIPGLRRLFELAVQGDRGVLPLLPAKKPEAVPVKEEAQQVPHVDSVAETAEPPEEQSTSTALASRTLGYHADTPALAPFLGKEPKKRAINARGEDVPVDILNRDASPQKRSRWRMAYTHRNKARAELDEIVEPAPLSTEPLLEPRPADVHPIEGSMLSIPGQFSRFHMTARVSIQDLSRWMPLNRRPKTQEGHTHKWRLQVSAPSYSLRLSTILSKLIVTSVTDPPPSSLSQPIVITQSPFVVTSTTDRPFLARLKFHWAGGDELNPPLEVDHWVELDPTNAGSVALGEEQVFDVSIDRNTKLLPAGEEPEKVSWDLVEDKPAQELAEEADEAEEEPDYVVRLRSLVTQFPLTQRDVKGRLSREVPYTLVTTHAQFRHLVCGRRKAIEWGRARALRDAYEHLCATEPWEDGRNDIPLTTGDVFRWLEDEGYFLRKAQHVPTQYATFPRKSRRTTVKTEDLERPAQEFCRFCGLHYASHPSPHATESQQDPVVGLEDVKLEPIVPTIPASPAISSLVCTAFNCTSVKLPVFDVNKLVDASPEAAPPNGLHHSLVTPRRIVEAHLDTRNRDLVGTANPGLVGAIQELGRRWGMDHLVCAADEPPLQHPRDAGTETKAAAVAALALAVRGLARTLVRSGTDEYRRDDAGLRTQGRARQRKMEGKRLLTPAHVVRGLLHDAPRDRTSSALLLALLPVGMSLPALETAPGRADEEMSDVETAPGP